MENISPEKLLLISTLISLEIVRGKTVEEIGLYRNLFSAISSNLQTYCTQKIFFDKNSKNESTN